MKTNKNIEKPVAILQQAFKILPLYVSEIKVLICSNLFMNAECGSVTQGGIIAYTTI